MCVSLRPAQFSGTTIYLGEGRHPQNSSLVHVLGYENTAVNKWPGPNAMLIPIPSAKPMGPQNFLDTNNNRYVLKDMVKALTPTVAKRRNRGLSNGFNCAPMQVFDHDIYTVILAENADDIPGALSQVSADRRPNLNQPLFDFYKKAFPGYHLALFCFNNKDAKSAAPTLLWYVPMKTEKFRLPALDCHSGDIPNLHSEVVTDHWVISSVLSMPNGSPVHYQDPVGSDLAELLPSKVMGRYFWGTMYNGDFGINRKAVLSGDTNAFLRLPPPN